jgi:hypothetical protein
MMSRPDFPWEGIPCIVYAYKTYEEEVEAFRRLNKDRRSLSTRDDHHAALEEGDKLAIAVEKLVQSFGMYIGSHPHDRNCIKGVATLYTCYEGNFLLLQWTMSMLRYMQGLEEENRSSWQMIKADHLAGLFWLVYNAQKQNKQLTKVQVSKLRNTPLSAFAATVCENQDYGAKAAPGKATSLGHTGRKALYARRILYWLNLGRQAENRTEVEI